MNLKLIESKIDEIKELKNKIMEEVNIERDYPEIKYTRNFSELSDVKIACIMDEFTFNSFNPECDLKQLTPDNWQKELESFDPDMFFIESAWRGFEELWNRKVSNPSEELINAIQYCKRLGIPVVFWNKEDPVHFGTFIGTAKHADFVFTTDIDCIKKYKTILQHDRVFLMPFAAQTSYHNPIENYNRKNKFCFAGSYYKRYPERIEDLKTFIDTISSVVDIDIYDRNYYNNNPDFEFPESYKQYIVGNLKANEIDKAYKGYKYNINMNSVKKSQSMCARRVFELLASNTVTVSNYSRGIRNFLGDLVICTDDGNRLKEEILKLEADEEYYRKFRLLGLRKVLSEHTYRHRLLHLVNTVYDKNIEFHSEKVAVLSVVNSLEELDYILSQFDRQTYESKKMYIVTQLNVGRKLKHRNDVEIVQNFSYEIIQAIQSEYKYWSFFSTKDYYGQNYLLDFILALNYAEPPVISKATYFNNYGGSIQKIEKVTPYSFIESADIRNSIIRADRFNFEELISFTETIDEGRIFAPCLVIDEYNYCMNFIGNACPTVDDLEIVDTGILTNTLYNKVKNIKIGDFGEELIRGRKAKDIFNRPRSIRISQSNEDIYIDALLEEDHEYLYMKKLYSIEELGVTDQISLDLSVTFLTQFSVSIAAIFLDRNKKRVSSFIRKANTSVTLDVDKNVKYVKFGIRVSGSGVCTIDSLRILKPINDTDCHISKSDALLISGDYPSYQDLYRYAFIHSRIQGYRKQNEIIDIFKFNKKFNKDYSEFSGIDVASGYRTELSTVLNFSEYKVLLIHFLTDEIWTAIKEEIKGRRVLIWIHGSDIHPWWRREFNYDNEYDLEKARMQSDQRMEFWNDIFKLALEDNDYDLHFVFVSNYFANEVFEDYGIKMPKEKYSVIHNYVNNGLFNYSIKDSSLRKKILSIRPFSSHKYANDLTVKAILELSKEVFFHDLEFTIIGKGQYFESLLKPLERFSNVTIENRFLRQEEIAMLHRDFGVFLNPTRWDSQGVSRDEAMSSGLVPVTNKNSAIPEFVDETCGIIAEDESYVGLAEGIKRLYFEPELFERLSANAAKRVRDQSGYQSTIMKEISLLKK